MSLEQLKDQAANLQPHEQRELIAYLVSLRTQQDQSFKEQLTRKIEDRDPANWIELDELRKKLPD
jgi:hypothetical protein